MERLMKTTIAASMTDSRPHLSSFRTCEIMFILSKELLDTYLLLLQLIENKLNYHFVFHSQDRSHLFRHPWPQDIQVDFRRVHLSINLPYDCTITTIDLTFRFRVSENFICFRSFLCLSENRLSCSALVPYKQTMVVTLPGLK